MKKEIWKNIKGYEGYYEVSSYGRVRSVDRMETLSDGRKRLFKGRIMKPANDKDGYLLCSLCKNGRHTMCKVHRLVAEAFITNPDNLPEVNHKDEDKTNNCVFLKKDGSIDLDKSNLEWCTRLYNMRYGTGIQRMAEKHSKSVLQLDINRERVIAEYPSAIEAARQTGFSQGHISDCCRGEQKTYKGFKWRYQD